MRWQGTARLVLLLARGPALAAWLGALTGIGVSMHDAEGAEGTIRPPAGGGEAL